eukprot:gene1720-1748_t
MSFRSAPHAGRAMKFFSDNAASVHPRVWAALQSADAPDTGYDGDMLSRRLDEAFSALFGQPATAIAPGHVLEQQSGACRCTGARDRGAVKPAHPPEEPGTKVDPRVIAAFVITALVWGSTWLVIKGQIGPVPPSWSVTWRFVGAAVGMFALGLVRGEIPLRAAVPERRVLIHAALIGVSLFCANFQFVYRAETHLTSGLVAVVFALLVVPNAVFSRLFLGTRVTRGFVAGSLIALGGIVLLMINEYRAAAAGSDVPLGAAMTVLALMFASTGNVLQAAQVARTVPAAMLLAWAFLFGAVADFAVAWVLSGPPVFDWSPAYLCSVAYLSLIDGAGACGL